MTVPVADLAEAETFLAAHPGLLAFDVVFTTLSGVARGKRLRAGELLALYDGGRPLPVSTCVVDIRGEDVTETGLVWETGDRDGLLRPVPGTLVPAPFAGTDMAQVSATMFEDGEACDLDPRAVLARVLACYAAGGLTPVVACELEFYLVDAERAPGERPRLARITGVRPHAVASYGLAEMADLDPFLRELWVAADAQRVPLQGAISEHSAGQYELTLQHGADALRAADEAVLYKRIVKGVARRHGWTATFMAKPFGVRAGSGMHIHASVLGADGANIFAADAPEGSPALRHAIGGLKATMGEAFLLFAPNMNSYRRFRAGSYAPVAPGWGLDNRTVPLRVPGGAAAGRRVEHRVCGADANPYLALAAVLAGMHHGIAGRMDPGPPVVGNGYTTAGADGARLPGHWFAAVDAFEAGAVMRDYLGARLVEKYAILKRVEQERYFAEVPEQDYAWTLRDA